MLIVAAVLFALATVAGATMAYVHFTQGKNPPDGTALLHGLLAGSGLAILIIGLIQLGVSTVTAWSAGLFVVAALGGFFLLSYQVRRVRLPSPVVVIHALVAVTAFVLLLAALFAPGD
jgi:hypothetical protein